MVNSRSQTEDGSKMMKLSAILMMSSINIQSVITGFTNNLVKLLRSPGLLTVSDIPTLKPPLNISLEFKSKGYRELMIDISIREKMAVCSNSTGQPSQIQMDSNTVEFTPISDIFFINLSTTDKCLPVGSQMIIKE